MFLLMQYVEMSNYYITTMVQENWVLETISLILATPFL